MFKLIFTIMIVFFLAASFGEAVKCYHCYDSTQKSLVMGSFDGMNFSDKFIRCDKNKNNWNTWDCPVNWPVCIIMGGKVINHYEVLRTCAKDDFCSKYVPPAGVKVDYCQECNTTLCNDYPLLPDPPVRPDSLFTFNININLTMIKYPMVDNKGLK